MTDETTSAAPAEQPAADATAQPATAAAAEAVAPAVVGEVVKDEATGDMIGVVTDGAYYVIVGQFGKLEDAQAAYADLQRIEQTTPLKIEGVIIASCDAQGKVDIAKATDHSTKKGVKWGVVGGVVLGVLFPPSILASAVSVGVVGGIIGKIRAHGHKNELADELASVMKPNTAGIVALVEDTAVVEVEKALAKADKIVSKEVDKQVAAQIDREAQAAKDAVAS